VSSRTATLNIDIVQKVIGAAAIAAFAKDIVGAASDAEQAMGGVDAVFKGNASAIKTWSSQSSKSLGLAQTDYQELATLIGSQLKNAGTSMDQLAPKTNDLITLGSDLAAQFGGSTADAVSALSSLLKGERDPIEKYGISITAADVANEELAMGLDTSTSAAKKQSDATATLSLLHKQSKDAVGANAREAETAAGKQARLTAAYEDAKATIGTALLPAYQKLMSAGLKLIPTLVPIVEAVANLAAAAADLPGPVLAAGAALAVWLKYGKQITGMLGNMRGSAGGAGSALANVGKSLLQGGALSLAAFGIGKMIEGFTAGKKAAEEFKAKTDTLADSIVQAGGKWTAASDELIRSSVESSDGFQAAMKSGLTYAQTMDLATGKIKGTAKEKQLLDQVMNSGASDKEKVAIFALAASTQKLMTDSKALAAERTKYAAAEQKATVVAGVASPLYSKLGATLKESAGKALEAAAAQQKLAEEQQKAAEEAAKSAADNSTLSKALADVDDASSDAKRSLDFLNIALDKLSGRNRSAEQAAADLNDSIREVAESFKDSGKQGGINQKALLTWNVGALTATAAGGKVYKSLNDMRDAYTASTSAAYANGQKVGGSAKAMADARAAATSARSQFIANAGSMGLNSTQAGILANKLGIVEGKKIHNKTFDILARDAAAQAKLRDVTKPRDAKITPKVSGTAPAKGALNNVAEDRTARMRATPTNTGPASRELDSVAATRQANINIVVNSVQHAINTVAGILGGRSAPAPASYGVGYAPPLPSLSASSMRSSIATITVPVQPVIQITGALDPDGVARQVERLLGRRAARTGAVAINRRSA
jgi:xanthosine utilization system XapX-like protein